jgi:hypothetical protein
MHELADAILSQIVNLDQANAALRKSETRNPKQIRITKREMIKQEQCFRTPRAFDIVSSFELRISSFSSH